MSVPKATGALLTGGASRRMGQDKAGLELAGRTLAQRGAHTLAQFAAEVVQVGRQPIEDLRRRFIQDLRKDSGPAAGIEAALADGGDPVVVLAVDLPLVPPALLLEALRTVAGGATIGAPRWNDRWHPLCAAYGQAALEPLRARLDAGELDLQSFLQEQAVAIDRDLVESLGDPEEMLLNINTPEDLAHAEATLRSHDDAPDVRPS